MRGLPAGRYTLRATVARQVGAAEVHDVEAGATGVEIRADG